MTRRYIFDCNAVSAYVNAHPELIERATRLRALGAKLGTCPPILGEFHFGIELSATRARNQKRSRSGLQSLTIWLYDEQAAKEYGRIAAELRRMGRPMQVPDMQLAAVAFTLGDCTVVSTDSDLRAIPGLKVEDWTRA